MIYFFFNERTFTRIEKQTRLKKAVGHKDIESLKGCYGIYTLLLNNGKSLRLQKKIMNIGNF